MTRQSQIVLRAFYTFVLFYFFPENMSKKSTGRNAGDTQPSPVKSVLLENPSSTSPETELARGPSGDYKVWYENKFMSDNGSVDSSLDEELYGSSTNYIKNLNIIRKKLKLSLLPYSDEASSSEVSQKKDRNQEVEKEKSTSSTVSADSPDSFKIQEWLMKNKINANCYRFLGNEFYYDSSASRTLSLQSSPKLETIYEDTGSYESTSTTSAPPAKKLRLSSSGDPSSCATILPSRAKINSEPLLTYDTLECYTKTETSETTSSASEESFPKISVMKPIETHEFNEENLALNLPSSICDDSSSTSTNSVGTHVTVIDSGGSKNANYTQKTDYTSNNNSKTSSSKRDTNSNSTYSKEYEEFEKPQNDEDNKNLFIKSNRSLNSKTFSHTNQLESSKNQDRAKLFQIQKCKSDTYFSKNSEKYSINGSLSDYESKQTCDYDFENLKSGNKIGENFDVFTCTNVIHKPAILQPAQSPKIDLTSFAKTSSEILKDKPQSTSSDTEINAKSIKSRILGLSKRFSSCNIQKKAITKIDKLSPMPSFLNFDPKNYLEMIENNEKQASITYIDFDEIVIPKALSQESALSLSKVSSINKEDDTEKVSETSLQVKSVKTEDSLSTTINLGTLFERNGSMQDTSDDSGKNTVSTFVLRQKSSESSRTSTAYTSKNSAYSTNSESGLWMIFKSPKSSNSIISTNKFDRMNEPTTSYQNLIENDQAFTQISNFEQGDIIRKSHSTVTDEDISDNNSILKQTSITDFIIPKMSSKRFSAPLLSKQPAENEENASEILEFSSLESVQNEMMLEASNLTAGLSVPCRSMFHYKFPAISKLASSTKKPAEAEEVSLKSSSSSLSDHVINVTADEDRVKRRVSKRMTALKNEYVSYRVVAKPLLDVNFDKLSFGAPSELNKLEMNPCESAPPDQGVSEAENGSAATENPLRARRTQSIEMSFYSVPSNSQSNAEYDSLNPISTNDSDADTEPNLCCGCFSAKMFFSSRRTRRRFFH